MNNKKLKIAIDGPAAAGKGTSAKIIAQNNNFSYLDTGSLYRMLALHCLENDISISDATNWSDEIKKIDFKQIDTSKLKSETIGNTASKLGAINSVRASLLDFQKDFILESLANYNGVVLDGRDIATNIMPDAHIKFYITASAEVRAKRRLLELQQKNVKTTYEEVLQDVKSRDERDMCRPIMPLKPTTQSIIIDTSNKSIDEVVATLQEHINALA